jgi:hypothetical protein
VRCYSITLHNPVQCRFAVYNVAVSLRRNTG